MMPQITKSHPEAASPLFDLSAFPLVRLPMPEPGIAGTGERWAAEFDAILGRGERFVLLSIGPMPEDEAHEDRKARTLWLKRRRADLGRLCLAHLHVERDPDRRAAMQDRAAKMAGAFPYPLALFDCEDTALDRAWTLLRAVPLTL
ncbi:hypothetical protein ACFW16_14720 [Inquilinus sp. NPDC058860]|uniref:hypothetical protein n=1 Tax=Inquilinus sp. NPDC058860 TaxID=3346652 RepID=UPI00367D7E58